MTGLVNVARYFQKRYFAVEHCRVKAIKRPERKLMIDTPLRQAYKLIP